MLFEIIHKSSAHGQKHLTGWGPEWLEQCIVNSLSVWSDELDVLQDNTFAFAHVIAQVGCGVGALTGI